MSRLDLRRPIYQLPDSLQVTGTVARKNGRFALRGVKPGEYYLEVSFIGYRTKRIENIQLAPKGRVNLGDLYIRQTAVPVEEVEVTETRPKLTYEIDKKGLNIARMGTPPVGTAVDVLKDAPSVKVDAERNVTLRGSSNFTVLIDNRPTLLEPKEALEQIPAVNIDRIEIITNLSANSGTWSNFGTKLGLRAELWRQTVAIADGETYRLKRVDLFPTFHLSYQLPKEQQWMASYTRRVNRPTAHNLQPYLIWNDPTTRTQGNSELKPGFIHSFDFGYQLPIGENRLSAETYYRITDNTSRNSSVRAPSNFP